MSCHESYERLSGYLDGELDDDIAQEVRSHVEVCVDCRWQLGEMSELREFVRAGCEVDAPPRVWERISEALADPSLTRITIGSRLGRYCPICCEYQKEIAATTIVE